MTGIYGSVSELDYDTLNGEIKRAMRRSAQDMIQLGYMLRMMLEKKMWTGYYLSFDNYLETELQMDYTMATRFIKANKKYSVSGGSMEVDVKYGKYSQAVLIEMLNMPAELEEKITPDMTVKQVREVKRQEKQKNVKMRPDCHELLDDPCCRGHQEGEFSGKGKIIDGEFRVIDSPEQEATADEVATSQQDMVHEQEQEATAPQPKRSAYSLEKTEYPEGSLLSEAGCGHKYSCFSCAQDCNIRQEDRLCVLAPLGNPFGCTTMGVLKNLEEEVGDRCQFVNNGLARHTAGSGEAVPCCRDCREICGYRCSRAVPEDVEEQQEADEAVTDSGITDGLWKIKEILAQEKKLLDDYLEVGGLPEMTVFRQKTIVCALAAMVCVQENVGQEEEETEQPVLPVMTNDESRKAFIDSYEQWQVWIDIKETGERYYRYRFQSGTSFVVKAYFHRRFDYKSEAKKLEERYHDSWGSEEYYIFLEEKHFRDCRVNRSAMVDFLKTFQKGGKQHEQDGKGSR